MCKIMLKFKEYMVYKLSSLQEPSIQFLMWIMEESFPYRLVIPKWPAESSSEASDIRTVTVLISDHSVIPSWSLLAAVQKQILSHTFCAVLVSSDWHKGTAESLPPNRSQASSRRGYNLSNDRTWALSTLLFHDLS